MAIDPWDPPPAIAADGARLSARDLGFVCWPFVQGIMSGAVTMTLIKQDWVAVFATSMLLNLIWWYNAGQRIDRHKVKGAGLVYAISISLGLTLGAWAVARLR